LLFDQSLLTELSADDHRWLGAHLATCPECSDYTDLSARAVQALDAFAFDLDPAAALRVQNVVRGRAQELAAAEAQTRRLWIGALVAVALTMTGSTLVWPLVAWAAAKWNLPVPALQIGFAALWLLPSLLLAGVPLARIGLLRREAGAEGDTI
jgi:predicted anti-sigma-YlaC factor YlaD